MSLISLVIIIVLIGIGLLAINRWIPMDDTIKKILNVVLVIVVIMIVLYAFGLLPMKDVQVPKIR